MSDLIWKLKRFVKKVFPIALVVAVLYGGYNMWRRGSFRHGVGPAVTGVLRKVPLIGSAFRGGSPSYSYSHRSYRRASRLHHRRHRRHRH